MKGTRTAHGHRHGDLDQFCPQAHAPLLSKSKQMDVDVDLTCDCEDSVGVITVQGAATVIGGACTNCGGS